MGLRFTAYFSFLFVSYAFVLLTNYICQATNVTIAADGRVGEMATLEVGECQSGHAKVNRGLIKTSLREQQRCLRRGFLINSSHLDYSGMM